MKIKANIDIEIDILENCINSNKLKDDETNGFQTSKNDIKSLIWDALSDDTMKANVKINTFNVNK